MTADWKSRIRGAFDAAGKSVDDDVLDELAQYAAQAADAGRDLDPLIAAWVREAAALAWRRGRPAAPVPPPATPSRVVAGLSNDIRYGIRLLRREPGATSVAVLTIALAIGATTALFSVAYGVLLKPLPWPDAGRIVRVTETRQGQAGRIPGTISNGSYLAWSEQPTTIEAIGGYALGGSLLGLHASGDGEPARVMVGRLTPAIFQVLRAVPLRGRVFVPDDATSGTGAYPDPRVIILSYGLWQDLLGGSEDVIGRTVRVPDAAPLTIVGVMPPDFMFPDRETRGWLPMPVGPVSGDGGVKRIMIFGALARVKPGHTFAQAEAEATARARSAPDPGFAAVSMFGNSAPPDIRVTSAVDAMTADVRPAITLLLAAVALLFVTAAANVGSLQLARATTRRHELAVRAAIGAGAGRLARQLTIESALLGVLGGGAGVLLALALHLLLPSLLPADFPRATDIAVNPAVLSFAVAASLTASLACALLSALQVRRVELVATLAEDGAASTSSGWRTRAGRNRMLVMAGQLAIACVLLVGAGLLVRSFVALMHADRGYDPVNLLTARVDLGAAFDGPRRMEFADAILARMREVPGVSEAAAANALPFVSSGGSLGFEMRTPAKPETTQQVQTFVRLVSPTYFQALRLRVLQGRALTDADTLASRPVVIVNRSFAERYLGNSAVGARLPMPFDAERRDCDVVGVVEDMRQGNVTDPPAPELFVSYRQMPRRLLNGPLLFAIRGADDPMTHVAALRAAVREREPSVALDSVMTMEERVKTSLARPRLYAVLLGAFASCALFIAGVGLFGILSYGVAQRTREIGLRTALGAQRRDIASLVLRQGLAITGAGLAVGLGVAAVGVGWMSTFLYGVTPFDSATFIAVPIVLGLAAIVACLVPARRAARIDPLTALRS